jgi:cytochrome c556
MRRAAWSVAILACGAGCDGSDAAAPPPAPREEQHRAFVGAMRTIDLEYEKLQDDVKAGRETGARGRVAAIRAAAEQASKLPVRASEAENRDLAFEFRKFIDVSTKLQDGGSWTGADGLRSWKQLGLACNSCHALYREDERR